MFGYPDNFYCIPNRYLSCADSSVVVQIGRCSRMKVQTGPKHRNLHHYVLLLCNSSDFEIRLIVWPTISGFEWPFSKNAWPYSNIACVCWSFRAWSRTLLVRTESAPLIHLSLKFFFPLILSTNVLPPSFLISQSSHVIVWHSRSKLRCYFLNVSWVTRFLVLLAPSCESHSLFIVKY